MTQTIKKYRYDVVDKPKKKKKKNFIYRKNSVKIFYRIFIHKELAAKTIMDCRTTAAHKFRTFYNDVISTKGQSVLTKITSSFEGENMKTQYNVSSYRIDLYFHDFMLAIEIDENGHSDRNIDYEVKRQKSIEQELDCKFIKIDPDIEDFDIFRAIK